MCVLRSRRHSCRLHGLHEATEVRAFNDYIYRIAQSYSMKDAKVISLLPISFRVHGSSTFVAAGIDSE